MYTKRYNFYDLYTKRRVYETLCTPDILQTDKVVMIFATLVAGAISEGRLKRKSS